MEDMFRPLRRYADFSGRARRREYWLFMLFFVLGLAVIAVIGIAIGRAMAADGAYVRVADGGHSAYIFISMLGLFWLAMLIPGWAVQVRRFHDQDMSGWFTLLGFVPYIGGLIVFVFMLRAGTDGENRFGFDPKQPDGGVADIFA